MEIRNVLHRGLRRLIERDDSSGLSAAVVERVRNMVSFLDAMSDVQELHQVPGWRAHELRGGRRGTWSLVVNRNWRITFRVDPVGPAIVDLDYEDYH